MGKSSPKQEVTEYRMSIHYGICAGPVDSIFEILVAEKSAWTGSIDYQTEVDISKPKLFGGIKKEGGVSGSMFYLPGKADQLMPARLAAKFMVPDGLGGEVVGTPENMPAYRGMASLFFVEPAGAKRKGFYWTANNPYLRGTWVTLGRHSEGLTESISRIYINDPVANQNPGLDLGSGTYSGSYAQNWDANGDYAAHIEQGMAVMWNLTTGASHAFPSPGNNLSDNGGCHVTDSGQIVFRTGGNFFGSDPTYLQFYNGETFALQQTIALTPYIPGPFETNGGFLMAEILVGAVSYAVAFIRSFTPAWLIMHYAGGGWEVVDSASVAQPPADLSVGPQYAYGLAPSGSDVVLFDWQNTVESLIAPPLLAGRTMTACHYVTGTDEVVVTCDNGDILVYANDLSVLLRSSTGNTDRFAQPAISSKRMSLSSTTIAVCEFEILADRIEFIHVVDVYTLEIINTIIVADTAFIERDEPTNGRVYVNKRNGGLLIAPGSTSVIRWWPFAGTGKFDSNPAHMIYESLINGDWGMGASPYSIDLESFEAAALVLFNERFGLSMIWLRQTTVEAFIREILDHIEATLFINPRTGLLTLKLIRDDYDVETLPIFDTNNSKITNFKRKLWGETVNELVVTWTNPANEQEETITVQDDANISIQNGEIVSDGRNYYGIRNAALATEVGFRDLRVASSPLATCDIEMDRSAWDLLPGGVCKIVSPEDGITLMVMRIGPVDYGRIGAPEVRATMVEDVFALATAEYSAPDGTSWIDPSEEPSEAEFSQLMTLPYFFATNMLDDAGSADAEYPTVYAGMLVSQSGSDTFAFELWGDLVDSGGIVYQDELGERSILARAVLAAPLTAEASTVIATWPVMSQGDGPVLSGFAIIGDGDEALDEIVFITAVTTTGGTINRGMLDTVPRDWPADTPIWFLGTDDYFHDNNPRSAAELVTYKALTKTSRGTLEPNEASPVTATLTERPHLPLRPANVEINGIAFGSVDAEGLDPIPTSWSNRNRLTEDAVVLAWDDATVTPEVDQLTRITIINIVTSAVITVHDDLPGTTFDIPIASLGGQSSVLVKFEAVRDGLVSLQGIERIVIVESGYGYGYGLNYGGL